MTKPATTQASVTAEGRKKTHDLSPAIKPGSYDEYLWNHPEEVQRILRKHGIDLAEINKLLDNGGGVILKDYETNHSQKEKT